MSDYDEMIEEIGEIVVRYGWMIEAEYPLGPEHKTRNIMLKEVKPPDLGIHIQDGVKGKSKIGG